MASATQNQRYQWMVEVGVSKSDVEWLGNVAHRLVQLDGNAKRRIVAVQDAAYRGLLATIRPAYVGTSKSP